MKDLKIFLTDDQYATLMGAVKEACGGNDENTMVEGWKKKAIDIISTDIMATLSNPDSVHQMMDDGMLDDLYISNPD